ncbi:DUF2744 domain-containing protein [Nocardia sp. NPDC052566]|uniref:phage gene 29 protein family protein n=1 Tax=Nocardia sp. NPDC052566 TaxID=3364330 RepID=UPI0037C83CA8
MRIPRQDQCDPTDPEQHALWALVCPPAAGETPMLIPEWVARQISAALWHCGFRHHPELQTRKFQRPYRGAQHPLNGSGRWVDINEPDPEPVILPNLAEMTPAERDAVIAQARALGMVPEPQEPPNVARIENGDE